MNTVPLGSVSQINPKKPGDLDPDTLCSFVPMEYVDDHFGAITEAATRRVKQVEKGYTYFHNWDVLFAKITPCMENGKCAIARNLVNGIGFGSTEFHVVRPKHDVMPEWIFYFLRQHSTRQEAARHMTGTAGQQRVPTRFLQEVMIPLPPLPEQKRITAILAKADRLRRLRRTARDLSDSYLQSVFLEMFGDPITNPMRWSIHRLGEIVKINPKFQKNTVLSQDERVSFVPMAAVEANTYIITDTETKTYREVCKGFTVFQDGDVLFAKITPCMENGKIVIAENLLNGVGFGSTEFHVLRPGKNVTSAWLLWLVRRQEFRKLAEKSFTGTAGQQRVPASFLDNCMAPLPPLPLQQQFAHIVHKFERLRAQQREAERQADYLFQTLLHQAFRGEPGGDPKGFWETLRV